MSGSEAAISGTEASETTAGQIAVGAGVTAALALAGLVPAWLHRGTWPLVGSAAGEVWGHAWVQWWHADALPDWPDGPGAWLLDDRKWAVIDPLTTLFAATIGALVDPVFAWNLTAFVGIASAFVGGAILARSQAGDPLSAGSRWRCPSFLGSVARASPGSPWDWRRSHWDGWGARRHRSLLESAGDACVPWTGACLGAVQPAAGLGIAALWRAPHRKHTVVNLAGAAALAVLSALLPQRPSSPGVGHRTGQVAAAQSPLAPESLKGIDLAACPRALTPAMRWSGRTPATWG